MADAAALRKHLDVRTAARSVRCWTSRRGRPVTRLVRWESLLRGADEEAREPGL